MGLVVPNFLADDLNAAKERFANVGKFAEDTREPDGIPNPKPIMDAKDLDDAADVADRIANGPIPDQPNGRDQTLINVKNLDQHIEDQDYTQNQLLEDRMALKEAAAGFRGATISKTGVVRYKGEMFSLVPPSDLPQTGTDYTLTRDKYQTIRLALAAEGKRLVLFKAGRGRLPDGFANRWKQPGVVFMAANTSVDPMAIVYHEVTHLMEGTPLHDAYITVIKQELRGGAKSKAYLRHGRQLNDEQLLNEIGADIHGDAMHRKDFWDKVFLHMTRQIGESAAHANVLNFLRTLKEMIGRVRAMATGKTWTGRDGKPLAAQYVRNLERVHDALARAVAAKYLEKGYGTANAPAEIDRINELDTTASAFTPKIPPEHVVTAFKGLAEAQRGKPERATMKVQEAMGGGVVNPLVEHVGDLTHRLTEMSHYGLAGQPYVQEKVERAIRYLSSQYGFAKEMTENIKSNASYYKTTPQELRQKIYAAMKEYADAHKELPVYNETQFLAREAAVAVGERRWDDALSLLKKLDGIAKLDAQEYHEKAFEYRVSEDGAVIPHVDVDHASQSALENSREIQETITREREDAAKRRAEKVEAVRQRVKAEIAAKAATRPVMLVGKEKILHSKSLTNKLIAMIRTYSAVRGRGTNEQLLGELHATMVQNLLWLHDLVPTDLRARAKLWYEGAHKMNAELADKYALAHKQADAVVAVLSPQKDWFMNVSLAERTMAIMKDRQYEAWTPAMTRFVESYHAAAPLGDDGRRELLKAAYRLEGQVLADMNVEDAARFVRVFDEAYHERAYRLVTPEGGFLDYARFGVKEEADLFGPTVGNLGAVAWGSFGTIEKAVSVIRDGSDANIETQLGHAVKVHSFYQNMVDPHNAEGHVTIDTHAVAAALLRSLSGNSQEVADVFSRVGMYKIFADAYRDAAAQRNLQPREMQSVTWEAVRGLFPWSMKKVLAPKVDQIWKAYRAGKISQAVAREKVFALSGGISKFMWQDGGEGLSPKQGGQSFDASIHEQAHLRKERVIHDERAAFRRAQNTAAIGTGGDGRSESLFSVTQRPYQGVGLTGTTLKGLPTEIRMGDQTVEFQGFAPAQEAARTYMKRAGLAYNPETTYHKLDITRAKRLADAYERLEHNPNALEVKAAYRAMIDEASAQYEAMLETGLHVEFIEGDDPYGNPRNAILDVVQNNHLFVFSTMKGFGSDTNFDPNAHPLLEKTKFKISGQTALANDIFRAVHDYFGHIKEGVGFRAEGEDNAWYSHVAMFTPLAAKAMSAETRGQNSWVNYGPYGEANRSANPADTHYADQKAAVMPDWAIEREATVASPNMINLDHYSHEPNLETIHPKMHGTGQAGAEMQRKANAEPGTYVDRSYFYRAGAKPETRFRHANKYRAQVDANRLMDLAGIEGDRTEAELKAKNAGYAGFYNSEGADPRAVALFHPTKVIDRHASSSNSEERDSTLRTHRVELEARIEELRDQLKYADIDEADDLHDELDRAEAVLRKWNAAYPTTLGPGGPSVSPPHGSTFPLPVTYDVESTGKLDYIIRRLQDKNIDIKRFIEAVKKYGGDVPDEANPILHEEMYHSLVAQGVADFKTDELLPLMNAMRLRGVTYKEMNDYLHARHLIDDDVNARLLAMNPGMPNNTKLGGMSDAEANAILASADLTKLTPLAQMVDAITKKTRRLMVEYGLENAETIADWELEYQSYVPLRREGFDAEGYPTGQGLSVRGSTAKMRMGSEKTVSPILANIAQARDQVIARGEKMKPVKAFAGLLMMHPNKEIATLVKPAPIYVTNPLTGLQEAVPGDITTAAGSHYGVPMIRVMNNKTGTLQMIPDPTFKGHPNVVNFRVAGVDYGIVFNEDNERAMEIAKAFKNLDTPALNGFLSGIAPFTRYLAAVNTQYNPIFGIVNFVRDAQFAMLTLQDTPIAGRQKDVLKAAITSLGGIYADARAVRNGQHGTSPTSILWERFQHVGGPTGYRDIFRTVGDRTADIEAMLNPKSWSQIRNYNDFSTKVGNSGFAGLLSDYNQTMENAMRLGVFKVATDQGMSDIQAASLAKNITVNFNKKGQLGAQMGSLYAFFNANVQGTARIAETMLQRDSTTGNISMSALGKKIFAGGVLIGVLQTFALAMMGYDEDDVPEFVKQRALVLPIPGTNKKYATIPMPLGFNLIPNIGRLAAETMLGYYTHGNGHPMDHAYRGLAAMLSSFMPTGGSSSITQELMPTIADPIVALDTNIDWTGKPIYREDIDRSRPTPGFSRKKDTSTVWAQVLAKGINFVTGGNEYRPGIASPTPDAIDYAIGTLTGGVGREASKLQQTASALWTGEEFPEYKVPLLGRFLGSASGKAATREKFYDTMKAVHMSYDEFKHRAEKNDHASAFHAEHPEVGLNQMVNQVQDLVSKLQTQKHQMIESGASRESVRLQEQRINELMARVNAEYERVRK